MAKIFLSYNHSTRHQKRIRLVTEYLLQNNHEIINKTYNHKIGSNIYENLHEQINLADIFVALLTDDVEDSKFFYEEVSFIALTNYSTKIKPVIPVILTKNPAIPSFFSETDILDISDSYRELPSLGIRIDNLTSRTSRDDQISATSLKNSGEMSNVFAINALEDAYSKGNLTLVCGAGVSVEAGIPSWNVLLLELLKEMVSQLNKDNKLQLQKGAAEGLAQNIDLSPLIIGKYLKNTLGDDFATKVREHLYKTQLRNSKLIEAIVKLAKPQRDRKPLEAIITLNFDDLLESAISAEGISYKPIYSESIRHKSSEIPIYHVHGYLPRKGKLEKSTMLVFSEDAYHEQFVDPFSWSNLVQLNKYTQTTCLFIGLSLTDPNLRRLLDVASRKSPENKEAHFIIKKRPKLDKDRDDLNKIAQILEEKDANALGLKVIWVNEYSEIPVILTGISEPNK